MVRSGARMPSFASADALVRLAPVLFAMGFVLTVFADSGSALEALPRPLAIAGIGAFVLEAVAALALRSWNRGAMVALVLVIFLVNPLFGMTTALIVGAIALVASWRGFSAAPFARGLATVVAILFAIAAGRAVLSPGFQVEDFWRSGPAVRAASAPSRPSRHLPADAGRVSAFGYARSRGGTTTRGSPTASGSGASTSHRGATPITR